MTASQTGGIQNLGAAATVIGIGHNPASAEKVNRYLHLHVPGNKMKTLSGILSGEWSGLAVEIQKSRFAAFERLLASYVVFHTAAAKSRNFINFLILFTNLVWAPVFLVVRVITFWRIRPIFGFWNLSRTQSGTRIATTAAPVPANIMEPQHYRIPTQRNNEHKTHNAFHPYA